MSWFIGGSIYHIVLFVDFASTIDTNKDIPVALEGEHTTNSTVIHVTLEKSQSAPQEEMEDAGGKKSKPQKKKTELVHSLLLILLGKKEATVRLEICMYE